MGIYELFESGHIKRAHLILIHLSEKQIYNQATEKSFWDRKELAGMVVCEQEKENCVNMVKLDDVHT